jgi:malate synthase
MEDAATAEIARAQLWQWLHHGDAGNPSLHLDDGTEINFVLFERALIGLPGRLGGASGIPGADKLAAAIALLERLTRSDTLEEFLTVPAYALID